MYIIVAKDRNLVLGIWDTISYQSNGNFLGPNYAIAKSIVKEVVELEEIPEEVVPLHYSYIDGEFILTEELPPTIEEQLDDAVTALEILGYTEEETNGEV